MAAWDKAGMFEGVPIQTRGYEQAPPPFEEIIKSWPKKLPEKRRNMEKRKGKALRELWEKWLGRDARKALPKQFTEPGFCEQIYEAAEEICGYAEDIQHYWMIFPEHTGMMHSNLQSDNGYFWRNAKGEMDCGIIDWGGLGPRPVITTFLGCVTSALGEVMDAHEDGWIDCWINEYWKECGIWCDFGELKRQWHLGMLSNIRGYGTNIQAEIYRQVPEEEWATITSIMDERVVGQWNARCYAFMIFHMLKYFYIQWKRNGTGKLPSYEVYLEWKQFWISKGLE